MTRNLECVVATDFVVFVLTKRYEILREVHRPRQTKRYERIVHVCARERLIHTNLVDRIFALTYRAIFLSS